MGYKESPAYQWYFAGSNQRGVRHENLPAFERQNKGGDTVICVCAGEVYCRMGTAEKANCGSNTRFSNETNLKNHVKKHKVNGKPVLVKSKRPGANSVDNETEAMEFYNNLQHQVEYAEDSDDEVSEPEVMATPKKPAIAISKAS